MAQKVQTLFIDDIDGSEAEGTVQFGIDGTSYEIDLSTKHAEALRKSLARYVQASRKIPASRRPGRSRRSPGPKGASSSEVREWARSQGIDVKERGRIPAELVVKFKAASGA
jgi:nucleoid-associated protein Lsr2